MADNVYVNQTLALTLETNTDISGGSVFRIYYKKPDKTVGYWTATRSGTTVTYNIPVNTLSTTGAWVVKSWVRYGSGATYSGDPVSFEVRRFWQVR